MQPFPDSKVLREADWHAPSRRLRVVYRDGRIYDFEDVSAEDWHGLLSAESAGTYLAHYIRSCKTCQEQAHGEA